MGTLFLEVFVHKVLNSGGFTQLCVRAVMLISLFFSLSASGCCERVGSDAWLTPHVDQSAELCCNSLPTRRCDTDKHRCCQSHLASSSCSSLFPVSAAPPRFAPGFSLSRRENTNPELLDIPPFILDMNRESGLFCSFTFYSPSLSFCSPHHTKLLSSPCACSQLLNSLFPGSGWAGIFDHRALFCIHVFFGRVMTCSGAITFCCFWIPVAPAGINHWSWVSGALPWST